MRRIAILTIGFLAALPAFSQAPAPAAPAAAGPAGAAGASGPQGPHPKSNAENAALLEMFKATDPDAQIKAAEDMMKTYPDTDYKAQVLLVEAQAYHQKKQDPKAIVLGEEALSSDPKNYTTLLLLADIYARGSKATDLNLNDNLVKADKYAKEALTLIASAPKPKPDLSDADWEGAKRSEEEQAYMALGFSALLHKKFDEAKTNFDKAIELYPDPLDMLYVERAYGDAKRYDDAIAWTDKAAASPNANDRLKQIAASDKTRYQGLKKAAQ
jgi:tetratricopeptide (TPR) repeat protein